MSGTVAVYAWIPNDGPLAIDLTPLDVAWLYLPKADISISMSATPVPGNGNPFYIEVPAADNPQTVPMPSGTASLSLSASSSSTYYVFVTDRNWRLFLNTVST